ncbi:Guanine nucleotide-binding protein subunit alpha-13, partial [Clydaea vesicula]
MKIKEESDEVCNAADLNLASVDNTVPLTEDNSINLATYLCNKKRKAKIHSLSIDEQLSKEKINNMGVLKLLVLGSGDSGKSTLIKQIRMLHSEGFSKKEVQRFKNTILQNIFESIKKLILAAKELNIESDSSEYGVSLNIFFKLLKLIQLSIEGGCQIHAGNNKNSYLDDVQRILDINYNPLKQDIVCLRKPTTQVYECNLTVNKIKMRIIDVGGQKSLRSHWLPFFDDCKGLFFVIAISGYDQTMEEDIETNRMVDSLQLFEKIVNNPVFIDVPCILFFNKMDLFLEKLKKVKIKEYFPEFTGNQSNLK